MRLEFIKYWDPFCASELNYGMPIILSVGTFWEKNVKHWDSFTQVSWNVYTYACSKGCKKVLRQFSLLLGPICLGGSGELIWCATLYQSEGGWLQLSKLSETDMHSGLSAMLHKTGF